MCVSLIVRKDGTEGRRKEGKEDGRETWKGGRHGREGGRLFLTYSFTLLLDIS